MAVKKEKSCLMKNLLWVILGCVLGIVLIVVIVLLSTRKAVNRQQYKECWSNDTVWSDIETLTIPDWVCNDMNITKLDFNKYPKLKSITIGNFSFVYVGEVNIIGLNELERVAIGNGSFIMSPEGYHRDSSNAFRLKDCPKIKSLRIGASFSGYQACEIENVDALEELELGNIRIDSDSFCDSSLELKSILIHNE